MRVATLDDDITEVRNEVREAAALLRAGRIVAYVTETVYGLACDATNPSACERLAELKGRNESHPFPIQVFRPESPWWTEPLPEAARRLFDAFSPGPITVVVPGDPRIARRARGAGGSVGVRVPNHPVALALLSAFGGPVACPSANKTGSPPALCAEEIVTTFGPAVEMVLSGGPSPLGTPSTVVDVTGDSPKVLRVGAISEEQVRKCLQATFG
ncbi:MAG: threonylcarbamoyl-AMP synthase [Fimbriimonadia bacterium]|jgi:L-threonylcarbamoyladenylate synthase